MDTRYRHALPQLTGDMFLTDGGIETTLIFHEGLDLPHFAAFDLMKTEHGCQALEKYFRTYADIAHRRNVGFVLESATWRASQDWGDLLGYSTDDMAAFNRQAIAMLHAIREEFETTKSRFVISGCVGPRGDGYDPGEMMASGEAEAYHRAQIETFCEAGADMVTAITITYVEEAIGITRAALAAGMPVVISFTVETDGCLPTGQRLQDAIAAVDRETGNGPVYYMINCAHPTHFEDALRDREGWIERVGGLRANASRMSHAELDEAEELDDGDPVELGGQYRDLQALLPNLVVMGGCCGTDHRHVEAIHAACAHWVGTGLGKSIAANERSGIRAWDGRSDPAQEQQSRTLPGSAP